MTFDDAMTALLGGCRVRRADWNRPLFVFKATMMFEGVAVPGIWMKMRSGVVGAYTPSQCDMLADDWIVAP